MLGEQLGTNRVAQFDTPAPLLDTSATPGIVILSPSISTEERPISTIKQQGAPTRRAITNQEPGAAAPPTEPKPQ